MTGLSDDWLFERIRQAEYKNSPGNTWNCPELPIACENPPVQPREGENELVLTHCGVGHRTPLSRVPASWEQISTYQVHMGLRLQTNLGSSAPPTMRLPVYQDPRREQIPNRWLTVSRHMCILYTHVPV